MGREKRPRKDSAMDHVQKKYGIGSIKLKERKSGS